MSKITAIKMGIGRNKKTKIYLDGKLAFMLENEVAAAKRLQVGHELTEDQIKALVDDNGFSRCFNASVRYLNYRPRSEAEIREKLYRRGFEQGLIETVMTKLKELGWINDMAFAEFWKDNRNSFSPRSQGLLKLELRRKGIDREVVEQVAGTVDNRDNAYRSAANKARHLVCQNYNDFRDRLGGYLRRRGFGYQVIDDVIKQIWQEQTNS